MGEELALEPAGAIARKWSEASQREAATEADVLLLARETCRFTPFALSLLCRLTCFDR